MRSRPDLTWVVLFGKGMRMMEREERFCILRKRPYFFQAPRIN